MRLPLQEIWKGANPQKQNSREHGVDGVHASKRLSAMGLPGTRQGAAAALQMHVLRWRRKETQGDDTKALLAGVQWMPSASFDATPDCLTLNGGPSQGALHSKGGLGR
jgi:hypothetical protein